MFFYVQSKTSIALVCDEKEIGKVDPMNFDSSFYVSTKCTPDSWTAWLSWRAWLAWLVLLCFSLPATYEVLAREASVPILNHTENVFRILAARKLEREQKKNPKSTKKGVIKSAKERTFSCQNTPCYVDCFFSLAPILSVSRRGKLSLYHALRENLLCKLT